MSIKCYAPLAMSTLVILAGCVTQPTVPNLKIQAEFNEGDAARALAAGSNQIKGSALLRQNGGGVVTCAGTEVRLIPETAYAKERIWQIYGSYDSGFRPIAAGSINFYPDPPLYHSTTKITFCDAQGYFKFDNLSDGNYYVVTKVVWMVPQSQYSKKTEGGALMQKVSLNGKEVKDVVLTAR